MRQLKECALEGCGTMFDPSLHHKKYCSDTCFKKAKAFSTIRSNNKQKLGIKEERKEHFIKCKNGLEVRNDLLGQIMAVPDPFTQSRDV